MSKLELWLVRVGVVVMVLAGVIIAVAAGSFTAPALLVGFSFAMVWRLPPHQRRQVIGF